MIIDMPSTHGFVTFSVYQAIGGVTLTIEQEGKLRGSITLSWGNLACLMAQVMNRLSQLEEFKNDPTLP